MLTDIANSNNGVAALVDHLKSIIEDVLGVFGEFGLDTSVVDLNALISSIAEPVSYVDTFRDFDNSLESLGSFHYIFSGINTIQPLLEINDGSGVTGKALVFGALFGGSITSYANNSLCLTDACLQATIDYVNQGPVPEVGCEPCEH